VLEFEASTRTSKDAAAALGCTVAEIAKSVIFKAADGRPVLVVASGVNRVDEARLRDLLGQEIGRADAEYVREVTGFAIGGVPPGGHATQPIVVIDRDLQQFASLGRRRYPQCGVQAHAGRTRKADRRPDRRCCRAPEQHFRHDRRAAIKRSAVSGADGPVAQQDRAPDS
jgi:prolyl-tRNA editing enzyme YbaK/EbsC (Cys-tRNA(Pro) deacylase)